MLTRFLHGLAALSSSAGAHLHKAAVMQPAPGAFCSACSGMGAFALSMQWFFFLTPSPSKFLHFHPFGGMEQKPHPGAAAPLLPAALPVRAIRPVTAFSLEMRSAFLCGRGRWMSAHYFLCVCSIEKQQNAYDHKYNCILLDNTIPIKCLWLSTCIQSSSVRRVCVG